MPPRVRVPDDFGYRPFTLADARAIGIAPRVVRGSRFRRIFRGVYIRSDVLDTPLLRLDAARHLAATNVWAMCHTAAAVYDVPVPDSPGTHVGLPPGCTRPRGVAGLVAHRHSTRPATRVVRGREVATPEDTFLQLAAYLDLVDLVIVGDRLVRLGWTTCPRLVDTARSSHRRCSRHARRAAALVRARVDSPMETRVRLLVLLAGLPEPATGRMAYDGAGGWIATPDLSYPAQRIAIEYDGADHTKPRQRHRDNRRRESYEREGWRLIVVTSIDVYTFPAQLLVRVWTSLRERRHPGVPEELSERWRDHFDPRRRRTAAS
jgi:hypothetical protein